MATPSILDEMDARVAFELRIAAMLLIVLVLIVGGVAGISWAAASHASPSIHAASAKAHVVHSVTPHATTIPSSTPTALSTLPSSSTPSGMPAASTSTSAPCAGPPIGNVHGAHQILMVSAPSMASTTATFQAFQLVGGCWQSVAGPVAADLGYGGLSTSKSEGDGTTPVGYFDIANQLYGNAPPPGGAEPYHQLVCGDWWDEDPSSPTYNTFVNVACGTTPPFGGGSEALWQETTAYQHFAVIEYNAHPIVPGAGSAIFLHDSAGGSTAGCVSIDSSVLDRVLAWLDPNQSPMIAIGTTDQLAQF
jgi:L,D-peptidoglycan transpeptidase YkuD (ErfK/YbiS/YcfS/YnhG family)